MKNKNLDPMAVLEWENFEWPLTVSGLKCLDGIYELPPDCQLTITRNDSYKLTGRLSGQIFDRASIAYKGGGENEPVPGEFMETERVQARKTSREEVLLTGVVLGAHQIRGLIAKPGTSYSFEAAVRLTGIEFTGPDYAEDRTEKLLEFYLCGQTHLHWPRGTERKEVTKIAKVRSGVDEEINEPVQTCRQLGGISNDYLLINTLTHYIFVQEVDKSYLPEWSKGIQIEYRRKDAPIPVEEERKAISELVGFLIGSQLLKIGESHLDDSDIVIKKNAYSPWGDNVISRCSSQSRPPVSIGYYEDWGKIEILINQLLPAYLEKREAYHLTDVLWKSWIARELPIGTNLPVLSSGLETLAESYVKSNGLNREYNKEEKKHYRNLVTEELSAIKMKLKVFDYGKRVIDKMENPFNIGVGEKLVLFFQHLGFAFGNKDLERQALQARNAMTHGALGSSDDEVRRYIILTHAYESLFNRVLLKSLGYDGEYIDYSALGHPSLAIDKNLIGR